MCGIAGFYGDFDPALLGAMNRIQAHRGPDDHGTYHDPALRIGLAHRRLSIQDLSERGHQPMWDPSGRIGITYNGEIYNYPDLRKELLAAGVPLQSTSDTEALLHLWLRHGPEMLSRLNGIYAFGLWDKAERTLFLARDGLGVKPLYYAELPSGVLFASELKALVQCRELPRRIDPIAVQHTLTYLWCPAPRTLLKDVHKLVAGEALLVRDGRIARRITHYRAPYDKPPIRISDDDAVRSVRAAVDEAVRRQLLSDVPVGAFLSGGLDSSAVVSSARHAGARPPCFTIGFTGGDFASEGFADDLPYAKQVAKHLDVDLHIVEVGPEIGQRLPAMLWQLDEVHADPAPINVWLISDLARRHGMKVLLSGSGGDDLFTGYPRHRLVALHQSVELLPARVRRRIHGLARRIPGGSALGRRAAKALRNQHLPPDERLAAAFQWLDDDLQRGLYGPAIRDELRDQNPRAPLLSTLLLLPASTDPLQRMLALEARHFLADHNLPYTDKASMAASVEVRVPLLDVDLVALAASLPGHVKQRGSVGKWVLREAFRDRLPVSVLTRPKTGFGAPMRRWLRKELSPIVDDCLSARTQSQRGLFDATAVAALREADRAGRVDATYPLLALVCIELWCRLFLDPAVPEAP